MPASSAPLQPDGSFALAVLPGPGIVLAAASPRDAYQVALLDDRELADLFRDGAHHGGGSWVRIDVGGVEAERCVDRYNALALIKPDERAESLALDFTLRPARGLRGTVLGPDGKPLPGASVVGLTSMPDAERLEGASFAVEGLNPRRTRELIFHHQEQGLGKVLTLRGDENQALTVRLEPCGVVTGRVVDKGGILVPGVLVSFFIPGKNGSFVPAETGRDGRFRVSLVPGQAYSFGISSARSLLGDLSDLRGLRVESGGSKDLGDLPLGD
jgi:hypothetical protein